MGIELGLSAPDFSLYDTDRKKVSLSEFKEKNILLLFIPAAFTSVCTAELCRIRDAPARYNNINCITLGISTDTVFTLKKYKAEQQFNFPFLSDFNKEVSALYGCLYLNWILDMKGVSKRSAFIIDKSGILRYKEILENAGELPDFGSINSILEELNNLNIT